MLVFIEEIGNVKEGFVVIEFIEGGDKTGVEASDDLTLFLTITETESLERRAQLVFPEKTTEE